MDVYIPLYMLLLCLGGLTQGGYALLQVQGKSPSFMMAATGAVIVLGSAWLERDVLLGCGQIALVYILWRLGTSGTENSP